jgi:DNA gyrase/topoisomerase IV subunit A
LEVVVITPEKIDEWIHEIEDRPSSALMIVRYIASRLSHLAQRNEDLLAENIQLRTEKKIEEYETRVSNLEYQLDLLKRQLGGEAAETSSARLATETLSILIYNAAGEVLRVEINAAERTSREVVAGFARLGTDHPEEVPSRLTPRLLATPTHEELLFLFDSGRTQTMPVSAIPVCTGELDWKQAFLEEPRGGEDLAAIVPIGRMSLSDCCVQSSRRGCMKKMMRTAFESYVSKNFVGAGVKLATDRTCDLTLCAKDDRMVLVSKDGALLTMETSRLSYTIEDLIRMSTTDHIVGSIALGQKKSIVCLTNTGKCIHREVGWLEPAPNGAVKTRGQALFSEERRKTGVYLVGAGAVDELDWGVVLDNRGALTIFQMSDLFASGSTLSKADPAVRLLSFVAF